jgi:hypothetical protein
LAPLNTSPEFEGFAPSRLQVDWLTRKGWRFETNGIGRPVIARKYADKVLGCGDEGAAVLRPNFASLKAA